MTDRELLELSAKAAGIELAFDIDDRLGQPWTVVDNVVCAYWNPLTDDGDALRLAVRLSLMVYVMRDAEFTAIRLPGSYIGGKYDEVETHGDDPYAATRRAIVRAAAEIGKEKK